MRNNLIMPSVLLSIDSYYCHKILIRKKLIELRKSKPNLKLPFKCYIYCTKGNLALFRDDKDERERYKFEHWPRADFHEKCGKTLLNGKVIAEFICDYITTYPYEQMNDGEHFMPFGDLEKTCLDGFEIYNYLGNKDGYGWHISHLVIYDKPKELSDFIKNHCSYFNPKTFDCTCHDACSYQYQYMDPSAPDQVAVSCADPEMCITRVIRPPQSWCYVEGAFCGFFNLQKRYVERKEFFEL